MRISKVAIIACSLLLSSQAVAQTMSGDIAGLRAIIEANSKAVAAAKEEAAAAGGRLGFLARSFLPAIELHAGRESLSQDGSSFDTHQVLGADIQVNLYRGGRDLIEESIRAIEIKRLNSKVRRTLESEVEKASSAYWQIVYLKQREALLKNMISLNHQNLIAAQRRIKSGVAAESDRFEFEMHNANLERELARTAVETDAQKRLLKLYLGLDASVSMDLETKPVHDHDFEKKLKFDPSQVDYLFGDQIYRSEEDALSAAASHREWWPRLDAFAEYLKPSDQELPDSVMQENPASTKVGLKVSMSFPAGVEGRRESQALCTRSAAGRLLAEAGKQELIAHLDKEIAEIRFLHGQVHAAEQNILRAERYYRSTQSEYARGVKNSPDVLGASQKLFEMHHDRLQITKDFEVAKSHVLAKISN